LDGISFQVLGSDISWAQARAEINRLCLALSYSEERSHEVLTAVEEALSNSRQHAHGGDASVPIDVHARPEGDALWIEVHDRGPGLKTIPPTPDLSRKLSGQEHPRGWGLFLMRTLASLVEFEIRRPHSCNVRLRFDPQAPSAAVPIRILEVQE